MGKSSSGGSSKPDWIPPLASARLKSESNRKKNERRKAARAAAAKQQAAATIEAWEQDHRGHFSPEPVASPSSSISRCSSVDSDLYPEVIWQDLRMELRNVGLSYERRTPVRQPRTIGDPERWAWSASRCEASERESERGRERESARARASER